MSYIDYNRVLFNSTKEGNLSYVTTLMGLKDIMLSDISQTQSANTSWHHSYEESKTVKFIEAESQTVVARGKWRVAVQ